MARKSVVDMLTSEKPLNGEHHANLGSERKRRALMLAKALDTDLNSVIKRYLDEGIETYVKNNPGAWRALEKEFDPQAGKGGKKKKV